MKIGTQALAGIEMCFGTEVQGFLEPMRGGFELPKAREIQLTLPSAQSLILTGATLACEDIRAGSHCATNEYWLARELVVNGYEGMMRWESTRAPFAMHEQLLQLAIYQMLLHLSKACKRHANGPKGCSIASRPRVP